MSRIYFHSPAGTVEVRGWERAWMQCFVSDLASGILRPGRAGDLDRLADLLPPDHYLRRMSREGFPGAMQWAESYRVAFAHDDIIERRGVGLEGFSFALNTVMAVGNDEARLLARLHAQCEIHAWVDGPDRAWLADLIERARAVDMLRPESGWEETIAFLRRRDDQPVVTSYSVCDSFPNAYASDWMPSWPAGVPEHYDALTPEQQQERGDRAERWYDLPEDEQWERGVRWLRQQGGLQMRSEGWATMRFGHRLSVLDLLAEDYEARLDAAVRAQP